MNSLTTKKKEKEKGKQKHMTCHDSPPAEKWRGAAAKTETLKKSFGEMSNSSGVTCGSSKERTYCILPGINWPERERRDSKPPFLKKNK